MAPWIVTDVVLHSFELFLAAQDGVVETGLEETDVGITSCLMPHVAAHPLQCTDDVAEMHFRALTHEET